MQAANHARDTLESELGEAEFRRLVDAEYAAQRDNEKSDLPQAEIERIKRELADKDEKPPQDNLFASMIHEAMRGGDE